MYRGYAAYTFQRVVQQADANVCIVSDADYAGIRTYWQLSIFCLFKALSAHALCSLRSVSQQLLINQKHISG